MMSSTSSLEQQERNWLDIPYDVMTDILTRIGIVDILENAQKVCTEWHKVCKNPVMWRVINMNDLPPFIANVSRKMTCKRAIDRSQGLLVDITLIYDYEAELFLYVADRSSQLKRLEMVCVFSESLSTDALMKFPLLEELNIYAILISKNGIETVGRYCPMLKTLRVNLRACESRVGDADEESLMRVNEIAITIGQNFVEINHLELIGNNMTNFGLQVILDNCNRLETLDLRACFNIDLKGDLGKKCSKQIKSIKLPNDSLEGCHYFHEIGRRF